MTATPPPREAPRRVSDEPTETIFAWCDEACQYQWMTVAADDVRLLSREQACNALRDSRALVADLTRRLAEAERREREAWCAGRDAAEQALSDIKMLPLNNDYSRGAVVMRNRGMTVIRALNPPRPEVDRG